MTMEVLDGRSQEGNPLLKLRGERLLQQLPEAEDHADDSHPLQHTVHILKPLEQLLHDVGLVKVGPQRDQDLLVHQHELPELGHLAHDDVDVVTAVGVEAGKDVLEAPADDGQRLLETL